MAEARTAEKGLWKPEAPAVTPTPAPAQAATVVDPSPNPAGTYIGNRKSKIFHYPDCSSVDDMKESNKVGLASREEAINKGYVPCKRCNP
ncbi:MAG: Ada metal-binding domain-containing protein [Coriobacteriia bacterium]